MEVDTSLDYDIHDLIMNYDRSDDDALEAAIKVLVSYWMGRAGADAIASRNKIEG